MELKVIATGSKGNAYVLENEHEALLIECGVKVSEIKKAIGFNLSKVVGAIVSHEHNDHSKGISEVAAAGINVYATKGTHLAVGAKANQNGPSHRMKTIVACKEFTIGNFKILPFDVKHDAKEPVGFLIEHKDCGKVLFLTDTYYCKYVFSGLNNIIIEANYDVDIIKAKYGADSGKEFLKDRIFQSHFSLTNCKELLASNDLSAVNNIVLIHLSDSNSDEAMFEKSVRDQTGKNVIAARNGMVMNFNRTPF